MESSREDDPELADIRELFALWAGYLDLDTKYTTSRIIEVACQALPPADFNRQPFKELLLRVASERQGTVVSSKRLGWWLRKISGRVVEGHLEVGCQGVGEGVAREHVAAPVEHTCTAPASPSTH